MKTRELARFGLVGILSLAGTGCRYDNTIVKPYAGTTDIGWVREGTKQYRHKFILEIDLMGTRINMPEELQNLEEAEKLQHRLLYEPCSGNIRLNVRAW